MALEQRENEVMKIYVFYADVFLIHSFCMDLAALCGVNYFLRRRRKKRFLVLASAVGAVAGLLLLLFVKNLFWYFLLSHLFLNSLVVVLAFGRCGGREFAGNLAAAYMVSVLLGGIMEWLTEQSGLSSASVFLMAAAVFGMYSILCCLMQRKDFHNHVIDAQIRKREKSFFVWAYWDSGNQLRDPYTGQGICILSRRRAEELFDEKKDFFRLVPYYSLGVEEGMLRVTDVDELILYDGKRVLQLPHVAVGVANEGLLEGREYDVILHASFL